MRDLQPAVLAFDGGHTGCRAVLATLEGEIVAVARGGPVSPLATALQRRRALAAAKTAMARVLADRARRYTVVGACLGLTSGGENSPMAPHYRRLLAALIPRRPVRLEMDAITNLAGAGPSEKGVVVIAGGGAIAFATGRGGKIIRAGGWGSALGDEGSAYAIGRAAVVAVARDEDGRGPRTALTRALMAHVGARDPHEIRRMGASGQMSVREIAHLAPLVSTCATRGDAVARRILQLAAQDLAEMAAAVLRRAGWSARPTPVFATGGVFRDTTTVRPAFVSALRRLVPAAEVRAPRFPPVIGAVLLAFRDAGVTWSPDRLNRLEASWARVGREP